MDEARCRSSRKMIYFGPLIKGVLIGVIVMTLAGVTHSCKLSLEILGPWQKDTIKQLKKEVKAELELPHEYMNDDLYLARWLAAKTFHVDQALELLKGNLKWRKTHKMDTILKEDWKAMNAQYPYQVNTVDKQSRPLLYIKLGAWDIGKMATMMHLTDLGRHFTKIIEEADKKVWKARAKGKINVSQFTILVNLEGYNMRKHGCLHCLSFYSTLGETLQAHFPRVAERVVFINAPPMFEVVFDTLQRILNINARTSIEILGPDRNRWEPAILEYLERDQFPRDLITPDKIDDNSITKYCNPLIKYTGSCHCGTVKYEVLAPSEIEIFSCSCLICTKKQLEHFIVPAATFKLLTGHSELTPYTFDSHQAKHLFCSKCGVQSFFIPKCSHEAMAIVTHCVDSPLPLKSTTEPFNAEYYEDAVRNVAIDGSSSKHVHL